jgi:hypothetical protein
MVPRQQQPELDVEFASITWCDRLHARPTRHHVRITCSSITSIDGVMPVHSRGWKGLVLTEDTPRWSHSIRSCQSD